MARLVIYGAGGFGREIVTAARWWDEVALVSDTPEPAFAGVPVLSPAELRPDDAVVIAIADAGIRRKIAARPLRFEKLLAPTAIIGEEVEISEGGIFCDYTMVTASAKIGLHFHCNIYSYVAHDCEIGDFVTFAPKVCCNGNVSIGDGAYIGTGATIRQGITIGRNAIVGMGAVVVKDVPAGETVMGNPAMSRSARASAAALAAH